MTKYSISFNTCNGLADTVNGSEEVPDVSDLLQVDPRLAHANGLNSRPRYVSGGAILKPVGDPQPNWSNP